MQFQCQVLPDWDSIYKEMPPDAIGRDQLLPILKKVRFQVVFTPGSAPLVSHSDVTPPNKEVASQLQKAINNLQQVITGFLNEWSRFAVAPPLPEIDGRLSAPGFRRTVPPCLQARFGRCFHDHEPRLRNRRAELQFSQNEWQHASDPGQGKEWLRSHRLQCHVSWGR